jgi:diacylglycerol kinase family enzyme
MVQMLTCILNEKAGSNSAAEAKPLILKAAADHGWQARVIISRDGIDLSSHAEKARATGGRVVAGGGDGTIAAVATALVGTDAVLGVLPMGTLNHFAKDLGIPLELDKAVQTLFTGSVARVDVGEVNGRIFLNNSSVGFYPHLVLEREHHQRHGSGKWLALAKAAAHMFQLSHTLHLDLVADPPGLRSFDTSFFFVGNNRYALQGTAIGTRAILNGGKLWVCAAPRVGPFALAVLALKALLGFAPVADLPTFETDQADVRMRRGRVHVATDGEVRMMQTPLHYRSRPAALQVAVPSAD